MVESKKPWLYVTVDKLRGLAVVSGMDAKEATTAISPTEPRWSAFKRGWVIAADCVDDLLAYAQYRHEWVAVKKINGPLPGDLDDPPSTGGTAT